MPGDLHYSGSPQFIDGFNDLTRQEYDWSVRKGMFFYLMKIFILVLHQRSSPTLTIKIKLHLVVPIGCMNLS